MDNNEYKFERAACPSSPRTGTHPLVWIVSYEATRGQQLPRVVTIPDDSPLEAELAVVVSRRKYRDCHLQELAYVLERYGWVAALKLYPFSVAVILRESEARKAKRADWSLRQEVKRVPGPHQ